MAAVVSVENLSKMYIIDHRKHVADATLREALTNGARRLAEKVRHPLTRSEAGATHEEFWALKDVSFDIQQGDRVGIIGRNGAGKSTLLKILSRITAPTSGRVSFKGRVASLLEVGTGFHPELTGRENIFLNGAILGMSKREIRTRFDEIVAFAGVDRFLDTPVKRYSSGMYVRLAFSVAAHLEPEILIVDEVLAVGDAEFQRKCMGKMETVGKEGRTVVFVSHAMSAVAQLCTSVLRLDGGRLAEYSADVGNVISHYLYTSGDNRSTEWVSSNEIYSSEWFAPIRLAIADSMGRPLESPIRNDADAWVWIEGNISTLHPALQIGYGIYNEEGQLLYWTCHTDTDQSSWPQLATGRNVFKSRLPYRLLNQGTYRIELLAALFCEEWLARPGMNAPGIQFEIHGPLSDSPYWVGSRPGVLAPIVAWQHTRLL